MKPYKRTSRHLSPVTRTKISNALRGRTKTESQKQAISAGLLRYWRDDSNFPEDQSRVFIETFK